MLSMRKKIIYVQILESSEIESPNRNISLLYKINVEYLENSDLIKVKKEADDDSSYDEEDNVINSFSCKSSEPLPTLKGKKALFIIDDKNEIVAGYVPKTNKSWGNEQYVLKLKKEYASYTKKKKKRENERFIHFTGKVIKKQAISSMSDYNKNDLYTEIKFKGYTLEIDGFSKKIYAEPYWNKLKPGDKISGIAEWSNKNRLGEKVWLLFTENKDTGEKLGRGSFVFPWGVIICTIALITANFYGLFYDASDRYLVSNFLLKWCLINLFGVLLISSTIWFYGLSLAYAKFHKRHFSSHKNYAINEKESVLQKWINKPFHFAPILLLIFLSSFYILFMKYGDSVPREWQTASRMMLNG